MTRSEEERAMSAGRCFGAGVPSSNASGQTPDPPLRRRRRSLYSLPLAGLLAGALLTGGCSLYRVHAPEHPGVLDDQQIVWSYAWGLVPGVPEIDCQGQPLAEVTIHSHFAFDLLGVLTLGLASPKRIEWKCAGADPSEGEIVLGAGPAAGGTQKTGGR